MVEQKNNELTIAVRPEPGPLATLESLIKGAVKVHSGLLIQAFLSPVYKKGKLTATKLAPVEDVDHILETCISDRRFQEAKSRILAFRISSSDRNTVLPPISHSRRTSSRATTTTARRAPAKSSSSSFASLPSRTYCW